MITCLAVDDEPLSLDILEDNIRRVPGLNLLKRCENAFEASAYLQQHPVDLLFVDIQMPGITGVQFLRAISTHHPYAVFVTAYEQYAIEGYNLDVVDYLVKPVPFERFLKAIHRVQEKIDYQMRRAEATTYLQHIFVNSEYNIVRIDLSDILFIEGLKDYVKIFTRSNPRPVITRMSMRALENKLPSLQFVRVHKSFIVSLSKIELIRKGRITIGKQLIPISDFYKEKVQAAIGGD